MRAFWQKLTEKLGQARDWLRAKAWRLWSAIRQQLVGTTTRAISTVVVVALIIAIPLLVFVPGFQTAAITLLELGIDSLDILTQSTGTAVTLVAVYFTLKQRRGDREGQ